MKILLALFFVFALVGCKCGCSKRMKECQSKCSPNPVSSYNKEQCVCDITKTVK